MSDAVIRWISGPVLKARVRGSFRISESVTVGAKRLLGEVIRLDGQEITVQVYEDTTGLRPGDPVRGRGMPLSVPLGPGILGHIFDGLLRPLTISQEAFVKPGMAPPPPATFPFVPLVATGRLLKPGEPFGEVKVFEPPALPLKLLVPPGMQGEVIAIAPQAPQAENQTLCTLRDGSGVEHTMSMMKCGRCVPPGRWPSACPRGLPCSPGSVFWTPCFRWLGGARRPSLAVLAPARRCCWRPSPRGATPM